MSDDFGGGGWSSGPNDGRGLQGRAGTVVWIIVVVIALVIIWFVGANLLDLW